MGSRDKDRSRSRRSRSHQSSGYHGRRTTRSRSRSRSRHRRRRSRSRSHRSQHRGRSRSRSHSRSNRRENSRSSSSSSSDVVEIEPPIRSSDPKYMNSRVFIGRLPPGYTKEELSDYFKRYGPILDTIVHAKGYGFVQFSNEENAKTAVDNERGSIIKAHNVDVKMATEGRRSGRGGAQGIGQGGDNGRRPGGPPPAPSGRERSPVYNDRFRDPYRDQQPPPRDDPYYRDPYRRPLPPDQYDRYDDPYRRREPFDDPYVRDPYYAPPPPPRRAAPPVPMECEILMLNPQLRNYADVILNKLKALKIVAGILSFPEDQNVQKQLEEMAKQGVLYAIVINMQNEVHSSVILNILHGTPQEHRNMPLDDAISLVSKNFEDYLREKANRPSPAAPLSRGPPAAAPLPITPTFAAPTSDISYLLNLLADNRQLTVVEIEKIILYLRDRRDKMLEAEGRRPPTEDSLYRLEQASKPVQSPPQADQEELKNKILSILNGSSAASSSQDQSSSLGYRRPEPTPAQTVPRSIPNPAMINFDNPSVQQALDNLIQSGPNLLKSINPSVGLVQTSGNNNNGRLSTAPPSSPGYGGQSAMSPTSGTYAARPGGPGGFSQRPGLPQASPPETSSGYGGHQGGLSAGGRQQQQMYGASGGRGAPQPPGMRRY